MSTDDRQRWFLGLGAAAETLLFLLLRRRPMPTGFSASISLAILDMEGNPVPKNSPATLQPGGSYIAAFTVTNTSTQSTWQIPATLDVSIGAWISSFNLNPIPSFWRQLFVAGGILSFQSTFTIPDWGGGEVGSVRANVNIPDGPEIARVDEPINVAVPPPPNYSASISPIAVS